MTSYAPNYTTRYRVRYRACGVEHTLQLRKAVGASPATTALLAGTVHDIFAAFVNILADDFEFISADQADEGSDLFYPSSLPTAVTGLKPVAEYTPFQKITHTRFAGRAIGSRAAVELFGLFWEYSNTSDDPTSIAYDGIVTPAENAGIGTAVALLTGQAFANSGQATTWYSRATIKVNDFWLREVRKGGII